MSDKVKYPASLAMEVFLSLLRVFDPKPGWELRGGEAVVRPYARCERIAFAGSLRRRKAEVGDLELLYIPKPIPKSDPMDLFGGGAPVMVDGTSPLIDELLVAGTIVKRLKNDGTAMWGERNRFAVHVASGLPIDFFAATPGNWANYMVCRTGPDTSNTDICNAAIARNLHWCPYNEGFRRGGTKWDDALERYPMKSERDVFEFVGLKYLPPWERLKPA